MCVCFFLNVNDWKKINFCLQDEATEKRAESLFEPKKKTEIGAEFLLTKPKTNRPCTQVLSFDGQVCMSRGKELMEGIR